jgi:hypothetical protein
MDANFDISRSTAMTSNDKINFTHLGYSELPSEETARREISCKMEIKLTELPSFSSRRNERERKII